MACMMLHIFIKVSNIAENFQSNLCLQLAKLLTKACAVPHVFIKFMQLMPCMCMGTLMSSGVPISSPGAIMQPSEAIRICMIHHALQSSVEGQALMRARCALLHTEEPSMVQTTDLICMHPKKCIDARYAPCPMQGTAIPRERCAHSLCFP